MLLAYLSVACSYETNFTLYHVADILHVQQITFMTSSRLQLYIIQKGLVDSDAKIFPVVSGALFPHMTLFLTVLYRDCL